MLKQAWTNCLLDADHKRSGAANLWDTPNFSGAHILLYKKEETIRSTSFPSNR